MQLLKTKFVSIFAKLQLKMQYREELSDINNLKKWLDIKLKHSTHNIYMLRAICQYKAQRTLRSKIDVFLANVIAVLYIPLILLKIRLHQRARKQKKCFVEYLKVDQHMAYQIPPQIKKLTIDKAQITRGSCACYLLPEDLSSACRYFGSAAFLYPELFTKFLIWISTIRPHLEVINCSNLIQYCEYSATSSLRKLFLNERGISLVNVTHGEELISCRSAFSSFDKCFAWFITPRTVYDAMQIDCKEFYTFNPCADLPILKEACGHPCIGLLWPAFKSQKPELLARQVEILQEHFTILVRPHPNQRYRAMFKECASGLRVNFSNPHDEDVHTFLGRCSIVVGYSSAVLVQAAIRGREVLYIKTPNLAAIREYHPYYKALPAVELDELANHLLAKYQ